MVSVMKTNTASSDLSNFDDEFRLSRVLSEAEEIDDRVEVRVSDGRVKKVRKGVGNTGMEKLSMKEDEVARIGSGKKTLSDFDSAYAMVDAGAAARMSEAFGLEAEKASSYGFEPGDMVWGKVKSHPWWPGHVFSEALVAPSVRRTKREGHVLVAFFGDSSYGWFDPAELIPFEPNYAEKSRQTSSRSFVKAVDEAMDEASRRCALGLTCRCRNAFNYRPTNVDGYFAVDVTGYEPGAVYSVMQIKKSRERFEGMDVLNFVQQLALMPLNFERKNINFVKNRATALAYRRAAFEEFDETYAEAFGMQPVRPSGQELNQMAKMGIRAPLGGSLVTDEALSEKKSTSKPTKIKEKLKKDKYLFKRREETKEPRSNQVLQADEGNTVLSANKETVAAEDYLLQKRSPVRSTKIYDPVKHDGSGMTRDRGVDEVVADSVNRKAVATNLNQVSAQLDMSHGGLPEVGSPVAESASKAVCEDGRLHMDKETVLNKRITSVGTVGSISVDLDTTVEKSEMISIVHNSDRNLLPEAVVDSKGESSKVYSTCEDLEPYIQVSSNARDVPDEVVKRANDRDVLESAVTTRLPVDVHSPATVPRNSVDGLVKKTITLKRPAADRTSEGSFVEEKNKKKKKESQFDTSSENSHKRLKTSIEGETLRRSVGKSNKIGLPPSEKLQMDLQPGDSDSSRTFPSSDSALSLQKADLGNIEVELSQVVNDMLALALDPFYGVERNSSEVVRKVLLRFRSHVYQKSLVLTQEMESCAGRSPANALPENSFVVDARDPTPKHQKYIPRPEDPTRAGRKRSPSDRQEEMSAKRLKKLKDLKSMTAERKAGSQRTPPEMQREQRDADITVHARPIKLDSAKKMAAAAAAPARLAEPTMLVMKFPRDTTLPTFNELRAKFTRFGPLDHSGMRVFWKSGTCRVVFTHKVHAQAAYSYAIRNNSLFGHIRVNYHLRDLEGHATESSQVQMNGGARDEVPQFRSMGGSDFFPGPGPMTPVQRSQHSNSQLKSCLKKPPGDEVGSSISVPREVPRVKFMLGGEESNRGEQLMISNSKDLSNIDSSADGGASPIAMDVNNNNFEKVLPQTFPLLHFPPCVQDGHETWPIGRQIKVEPKLEPISFKNYFNTTTATTTQPTTSINNKKIDISHQMLSLLSRCNDIVTDVKCSLGYVPYHPL